jgi:hypothetical protein
MPRNYGGRLGCERDVLAHACAGVDPFCEFNFVTPPTRGRRVSRGLHLALNALDGFGVERLRS